jgi:uncharacterized protein with von Willebrand factor type A (vWA) domain
MAIKNLPSRFVNSIPSQDQIDVDKSGTESLLNHLMQSFNLLRVREECIQTECNNDPKDVFSFEALKDTQEKLLQIADMIEHELPGVVEDEINDEASLLRNELRELEIKNEIKKNALINKIIKLGSYTS